MGLFKQFGAMISNLKQPKYAPIYQERTLNGLISQRAVFHDPSDTITAKYYGGAPDAMYNGANVELSNDLTLIRAYGTTPWSAAIYPTPPQRAFSFQMEDGSLQVLVDTVDTIYLDLQGVQQPFLIIDVSIVSDVATFTCLGGNATAGTTYQLGGGTQPFTGAASFLNGMQVAVTAVTNVPAQFPTFTATVVHDNFSASGTEATVLAAFQPIFTKKAGAGQSYFMAIADTVYIGDGVDQIKYTPGNPNGIQWNWGIAAPLAQPTVVIQESGADAIAWQPGTVFSTMGFIVDPNNNIQQLFSVNASTTNTTQFGISGSGAPNFNTAPGGTTIDGTITWTCQGQITLWAAHTLYQPGQPIYDPGTGAIFIAANNGATTSGGSQPRFINPGAQCLRSIIADGTVAWQCLGVPQPYTNLGLNIDSYVAINAWPKNSPIRFYGGRNDYGPLSFYEAAICYPMAPFVSNVNGASVLCNGQPCYLMGATSDGPGSVAGVTANSTYTPWEGVSTQSIGDVTIDNDLEWICLGSATWTSATTYFGFSLGTSTYSVIEDSNGNMQVCITSGTSGGSEPAWSTGYGTQTTDGSAIWSCAGRTMAWTPSTSWYLPISGFYPPEASQPYGGALIIESGNIQAVVSSGLSGATAPAWSTNLGGDTEDNSTGSPPTGLEWLNIGQASVNSLSWTKGHVYAYSYKCRAANDYYASLPTGGGNIPPGLNVPNGPPTGGGTNAISTASPVFTITGGNLGAVNKISGLGSIDPQVDTICIWRDADGGGAANMFELTEIPAPPPKGKVAQPWSFNDYLPDIPTGTYPGLDNLMPAPVDESNNPPPVGFLPTAWHFQRIWGGQSTTVFFSGGPDVITGNPQEAFNPIDEFPFLSVVVDCIHTAGGLVVVLQTDIEAIYGGPATSSFFNTTLFPGKGGLSYNAIDLIGGEIFILTSDSQALMLTPSLQVTRVGFPIGDKLVNFDAASAYVTVHDDGLDNAVYVGDGATGFFRLNPHQVPQGNAIWSPFRTVTGGCGMLQSVTTAPGVRQLLMGSTANNQPIMMRNMFVFDDNGVPYDSWGDIGAITLADPGQIAKIKFLEIDFVGVGSIPDIYVALDDPRPVPNWVQWNASVTYDPPQVYGQTVTPPYFPVRYYPDPHLAKGRHIRIKFDYGTEQFGSPPASAPNEMYGFAIFGKIEQES